jgi:hypothetical protein
MTKRIFVGSLCFIFAQFGMSAEKISLAVFADMYECRHTFEDHCVFWLESDPNIDIVLEKVSDHSETLSGSAVRVDSENGVEMVTEIKVEKVNDSAHSLKPRYNISARVLGQANSELIPWASTSFSGTTDALNKIQVNGPEITDVDSDLYLAQTFLYISKPFDPEKDDF